MALSVAGYFEPADWFATGGTTRNTTGVSWSAGDAVVVVLGSENENNNANPSAPTNANLTFGAVKTQQTNSPSESQIYIYACIAGSSQTAQTITCGGFDVAQRGGAGVWVITGAPTGFANASSNRTESAFTVNPSAGSVVIYGFFDWNANSTNQTQTTASGTATERRDGGDGATYGQYMAEWVGVNAGSQSWGVTDYTGLKVTHAVIEVQAPAAVSVGGAPFQVGPFQWQYWFPAIGVTDYTTPTVAAAQPWAQIQQTPLPLPPPPFADILQALHPSQVETVPVPDLVQAFALLQPVPYATVVLGRDPSSVETVPVPDLIQAFAIGQPVPTVRVTRGADASVMETVPVFDLVQAAALGQPLQPAAVFVALQAGTPPVTSFYVPVITAGNLPQLPPAVQVALGLTPGISPIPAFYVPFLQAGNIPQPLQAAALFQVLDPSRAATVPVPDLVQAVNVAQAVQAARVQLGLTPGISPIPAFYVPFLQATNLAQPTQFAAIGPGRFPGFVETVPVPRILSSTAPAQPLPAVQVRYNLTPGSPPWFGQFVPTLYGTAIGIRLPDGRIYFGFTPGTPPPLGVPLVGITDTVRRWDTSTILQVGTGTMRARQTGTMSGGQSTGTMWVRTTLTDSIQIL